jgi:hypothetical protein
MFCCVFLLLVLSGQTAPAGGESQDGDAATISHIVTVRDERAVKTFVPDKSRIRTMVERGVARLTEEPNAGAAWRSLVATNDVVGIKVYTRAGAPSGSRKPVVSAVIEGLLEMGLPAKQIVVWDKRVGDLQAAGYFDLAEEYGVRVEGSAAAGYDENVFYEASLVGKLVWGDLEFGKEGKAIGRKSFVSKLVTRDITKIISVAPLLNHYAAGVTGHLYGLSMGSVDNTFRFEASRAHMKTAVPELYALEILGDRVVLNIVDALICQYKGEKESLLHYSSVVSELRFSKDPVALDVLSVRELERQRVKAEFPLREPDMELYYNATLVQIGNFEPKKFKVETIELK